MVSLTMIAPALAFALPALAGSYGDLCEQDPYCSYAPLSAYPKAKSYCSKYHEMAGYLPTPTTTLTATNTIYETVTAATVTKATTTGTVQSEVTIMSTDTTTNVILSATGYFGDTSTLPTSTVIVTTTWTSLIWATEYATLTETHDVSTTLFETGVVTDTATELLTTTSVVGYDYKRAVATSEPTPPIKNRPAVGAPSVKPRNAKRGYQSNAKGLFYNLVDEEMEVQCTACSCINKPTPASTVTTTTTVDATSTASVTATKHGKVDTTLYHTTTSTTLTTLWLTSVGNQLTTYFVTPTITLTSVVVPTATWTTTFTDTATTTNIISKTAISRSTITKTTTLTATQTAIPCADGPQCIDANEFQRFCRKYVNAGKRTPDRALDRIVNGADCLKECSDDVKCNLFNFNYDHDKCQLYYNVQESEIEFQEMSTAYSGWYSGSCAY